MPIIRDYQPLICIFIFLPSSQTQLNSDSTCVQYSDTFCSAINTLRHWTKNMKNCCHTERKKTNTTKTPAVATALWQYVLKLCWLAWQNPALDTWPNNSHILSYKMGWKLTLLKNGWQKVKIQRDMQHYSKINYRHFLNFLQKILLST